MSRDRTACSDRLVVRPAEGTRGTTVQARAEKIGSLEPLEGHGGTFVLHLAQAAADARAAWESARQALGSDCQVEPVLVDAEGCDHYPTGRLEVRFHEPPSDSDLESFASEHGLRLRGRNRFVPVQVEFETPETDAFLLDMIERLELSSAVHSAWADTLSRYRRS